MLVAAGVIFAFALWFGLFLLARDARDGRLRLAGGALVAVAISTGPATAILTGTDGSTYPQLLRTVRDLSIVTAAYLFLGSVIEARQSLGGSGNVPARAWTFAAVPLLAVCALAALFANSPTESGASAPAEPWSAILLTVAGAATVAGVGILFRIFREIRPHPASPALVAAAVVIAGAIATFYLPSDDAPRVPALDAIAVGMTAAGLAPDRELHRPRPAEILRHPLRYRIRRLPLPDQALRPRTPPRRIHLKYSGVMIHIAR